MDNLEAIISYWQSTPEPTNIKEWHSKLSGFLYNYFCQDMCLSEQKVTSEDVKSVYENRKLSNFTGEVRTVFELRNNEDLVSGVLQSILHKEPLSEKLVKKINKYITINVIDDEKYRRHGERPGEYKQKSYPFGNGQTGAKPDKVQDKMQELIKFMSSTEKDPLKVAAVAHCLFEKIHPFSQGNGRTGRMLVNYYLIQHNYPPITFFNEDKAEYLEALRAFDSESLQIKPMYDYFCKSMRKTWGNIIEDTEMPDLNLAIDNLEV